MSSPRAEVAGRRCHPGGAAESAVARHSGGTHWRCPCWSTSTGSAWRFGWRPDRAGRLDALLTGYLRLFLGGRYDRYRRQYSDVHERNVLFEVRPARARGVPVLARDLAGRVRLVRVGLQPIDLR